MNILENCSLLCGLAVTDEECLITVMNDRLAEERNQHSIPLLYKGHVWSVIEREPILPWIAAGIAEIGEASGALLIAGWGGQVLVIDNGACRREAMLRTDSLPVSIVRAVSTIGGAIYAAGMSRQVYERTGEYGWHEMDGNMVSNSGEFGVGFNAIDGFSREEIYAVGIGGEVWSYDGAIWRKVDIPVNIHLHCICCAPDDGVYIGGRAGILVTGRQDSWDVLDIGIDATIWGVHWFEGALYLIVDDGIYSYLHGQAQPVEADICKGDFLNFSCSGNTLWAFGRKKIVRFDGSTWSECSTEMSDGGADGGVMDLIKT